MKEPDLLPTSAASISAAVAATKSETSALFGKGRYKFWALGAIIVLAFWSMLTGTVSLNWSAAGELSDALDSPIHSRDLDVLEVEEREKVVRHMWDVYTSQSHRIQLPRFWQEAFEAAYEELASDDSEIRDSAVSEIAKMSMRMVDLLPPTKDSKHGGGKNQRNGVDGANAKSVTSQSEIQ